jgi:hypothetical protein
MQKKSCSKIAFISCIHICSKICHLPFYQRCKSVLYLIGTPSVAAAIARMDGVIIPDLPFMEYPAALKV